MENNNFYTVRNFDGRIKDPDQRITQEISVAASNFAEILGKAVNPIIDLIWFSARLYGLIGVKGLQVRLARVALPLTPPPTHTHTPAHTHTHKPPA